MRLIRGEGEEEGRGLREKIQREVALKKHRQRTGVEAVSLGKNAA